MKETIKCNGTFRTSFIESNSEKFQLSRSSKRGFLWRSLIFLSVFLIFYTRFVLLSYFQKEDNYKEFQISSTVSYVGRNLRSVEHATTTTAPGISIYSSKDNRATNANNKDYYENCTSPAILEFPPDGLTRQQRRHGWIVLHILVALYCFWLLAIICDDYFVPAIEQICSNLSLQKDVVGATFMAAATSSPELFMNCVGTFVTKGDIGVSTIVGSAVFNILAVPACCGFFVLGQFVQLDWWPVTRDCLMYCMAILGLIATLYDGKIMWYEALSLVICYFFYMAVMYYNDKMARTARRLISKYRRKVRVRPFREVTEFTPLLLRRNNRLMGSKLSLASEVTLEHGIEVEKKSISTNIVNSLNLLESSDYDFADDPWHYTGGNLYEYIFRWPITLLLWLTIPDSRRHPSCKFLTFLLSITWIGAVSYLVAYVITIIGDTLNIPDSVMGLTILAAGMSVPEAVSSVIVTRQGQGAMGISNSIGSNTFDILLSLGIPWFIKAYFFPTNAAQLWFSLNSTGFTYSAIFLLAALFGLFIAFMANRFVLDWKIGVTCSIMYVAFMIMAALIELNVFFPVNLPICDH